MSRFKFRNLTLLLLSILTAMPMAAVETKQNVDLTPQLHGVIRPRWEMDTKGGENRFQLRNARLSVNGMLAPEIDYYFQADFCDRGKILFLDGWGRIAI
ncbi:MAG: hypothetical protein K2I02_08220, partial [Duncaniella sp.]|nr:hypothetical protein [Duncaniella sp.]